MRPIAVDLFAGAGGLSLGLEQAGFDVAAAIELDPVHAGVHKFNFPGTCIIPRSVVGLTGEEIRKSAGLGERAVDLVAGGAPCQGFSLMGQRALDDPRNRLVKEFLRIVVELDASYFLFENVKGLTLGPHRQFLTELIDEFQRSGYEVQSPWRVLNAVNYGVPQHRERLFLIGAKKGLNKPRYPDPVTRAAGSSRGVLSLRAGPSCRDALDDLPDAELFPELLLGDSVQTQYLDKASKYALEMRCQSHDAWHFGYRRKWERGVLTSSNRTDHTDISRRRFRETPEGQVEPISRFLRLSANGVSNTLRAGTDSARGAFTSPRPIHYKYARCVTVREMARLHGFPDWFRFHETKWHGARQIGNSVAPPVARALGIEILKAMKRRPTLPRKVLELGNPELLRAGMAEMAQHFGVVVPIGRRDKKSGARKRKQDEIEAIRTKVLAHG